MLGGTFGPKKRYSEATSILMYTGVGRIGTAYAAWRRDVENDWS